jgi:conjugal transfer pilus assembly protein TraE
VGNKSDSKGHLQTWSMLQAEQRVLYALIAGLVLVCIVLSIAISTSKTQVVVVPSHLSEKITIVGNEADEGFKKVWGLFVAELAGNVTPANVDFMIENIAGLLSPGVYTELNDSLKFQAESIRMRKISIKFNAKDVYYSTERDMVWVYGQRVVTAAGVKTPRKSTYTYELKVTVRDGYPYITWFNSYKGKPLIEDADRVRNPEKAEIDRKAKEDEDKPEEGDEIGI